VLGGGGALWGCRQFLGGGGGSHQKKKERCNRPAIFFQRQSEGGGREPEESWKRRTGEIGGLFSETYTSQDWGGIALIRSRAQREGGA